MTSPHFASARALFMSFGAIAALGTACREPETDGPLAPAAVTTATSDGTAALGNRRASALGNGVSVDAITIETRHWNSNGQTLAPPAAAQAVAAFNALPTNVPGYTNEPVTIPDLACNEYIPDPVEYPGIGACATALRNPAGGHSDVATRYRVRLSLTSPRSVVIRFGIDFNGGVMLVDGARVASNYLDSYWYQTFYYEDDNGVVTTSTGVLQATVSLSAGAHTVEVVGFEWGSDAGAAAQFDVGNGWQDGIATVPSLALPLNVTRSGTGLGTVTDVPVPPALGLINCGTACSASYGWGRRVTLQATPPDAGAAFVRWTGACTGTASTCAVQMDAAAAVTAQFVRNTWVLTATRDGAGAGTLTPSAYNCGATCAVNVAAGSTVTLTATPDANSTFTGWSGACTGTGNCVVAMDTAKAVRATFAVKTFALTVARIGTGTGSVVSAPAGIDCGATCSAVLTVGTTMTLTATPASGSTFAGWSGACTGTGACTVTMSAARAVTAEFRRIVMGDVEPPVLACVASPGVLWPANHKMVDITVAVSLTDAGSGAAGFTLLSVTSSEPDDAPEKPDKPDKPDKKDKQDKRGANDDSDRNRDRDRAGNDDHGDDDETGDGSTVHDIQGWLLGTADVRGQLRAERDGNGPGRTYTLTYSGTDQAGNATTASCTVKVPHDQKKK
ncbi:MAG: InlB B-repeat-containing protein [Gemmatimonadaceae bacterium]